MSLTLEKFEEKVKNNQMDHEKIAKSVEKFNKLLEDTELVPYGSAERAFLETLTHEVAGLESGDYTDYGKNLALESIGGLRGQLKKKDEYTNIPVEKALKDLFMKQKVYSEQECYDALQVLDDSYNIGLNPKQIRYGAEGAAKAEEEERKEAERKKAAEEKRKEEERLAEARRPSWLKYVERHRPEEGKQYNPQQKKTLLSKMMVAANIHASNSQMPEGRKVAFNLNAARELSSKLMDKWAFKHITRDPYQLNELLTKEPAELAEVTQGIRRPFARMSAEDRKAKIKELKDMLPYMDKKDGRSSKYKQMYESIEGITEEQLNGLEECDDPKKNGEELLQNIFNCTEKYQKGKKSLRSKPDQACRFDQSVDILACLGKSTNAAKNMTEGLIDRINDVRSGHGQPMYTSSQYGDKKCFQEHSNATRIYKAKLQEYKVRKNQGVQGLTEPKDPWFVPPKPRNILPKNENATLLDYEKYKESPESLNQFKGDSGDFVDPPANMHKATWGAYRNVELDRDQAKEIIAGALAAKDTPLLYSKAWNKVGCDDTVFQANYEAYMNDPSVEALAAKLQSPEARSKYFADKENMRFENLNVEGLTQDYQQIANPAPTL